MNGRKSRSKPFKVMRQIGRGSYNPLILEGKSNANVTAKRVTLLPGFLVSGFSSKTTAKPAKNSSTKSPSAKSPVNTQRENLLKGDLQSFLRENNRQFRRSARILTKHLEQQNNSVSSCPEEKKTARCKNSLNANQENIEDPSIPKSILKNNSKSIFSQINKKYAEKTDKSSKKVHKAVFENNIAVNSTFSSTLKENICVRFKSALLECRQKIVNEIECTNKSILGECIEKVGSPVKNLEPNMLDDIMEENILFPKEQWVYKTPHKQKIVPFSNEDHEKTKLKPAVVYSLDQNINNLYEFHPQFNLDPNQYFNTNEVNLPVDARFMNKVGVIYKTPYKAYKTPEATIVGNEYMDFLQGNNDVNRTDVEMNCRPCYSNKDQFSMMPIQDMEKTPIVGHHTPKANRKLNFDETYFTPMSLEQRQETPNNNFKEPLADDVTFLLQGGEFKMQDSQKVKRQKTGFCPEFAPLFVGEGANCKNNDMARKKIFDFSNLQQTNNNGNEKPMFDFSRYSK